MKNPIKKIVAGLGLLAGLVIGISVAGAGGTFDGAPPAPLPCQQVTDCAAMDVQIHSRGDNGTNLYNLEPMAMDHGADCSAPPASHPSNGSYDMAVFQCSNHIMTSITDTGYGEIVLTPNYLLDWSHGPAVAQWDVSTERQAATDWWDVVLSPWLQNLTLPTDIGAVDLQGEPRNAIVIGNEPSQNTFEGYVYRNGNATALASSGDPVGDYIATGVNEAATRQSFRLTVTNTHIRFELLSSLTAVGHVYIDQNVAALSFQQAVVQFAHHDYNSSKPDHGGGCLTGYVGGLTTCSSWHWDNLLTPANSGPLVPFTIMRPAGNKRFVDQQGAGDVLFNAPSPANSYLRFSAIGKVQVSFNGGTTYGSVLSPQASSCPCDDGHFQSYFVPMPAGVQTVWFKLSGTAWPYLHFAQDFAIWSQTTGGMPSPTSTPIVATPTATAVVSATPSPTPTIVTPPSPSPTPPAPTATSTSVPPTQTPTSVPPTATPSPTATPHLYDCVDHATHAIIWTSTGGSCP